MKLSKKFDLSRILFIMPLILLVIAFIVIACAGFNKGIDFKTYYQFNVRFNTTITSQDYTKYNAEITKLADTHNLNLYSQELINEGVNSGIQIKVIKPNTLSDSVLVQRMNAFQEDIQEIAGINNNAVITIDDSIKILPNNWGKALLTGLLTIGVMVVVAFAYIWYRWDIKTGLSYLLNIAMSEALTLSLIAIFRLPLNINYMLPYYAVALVGTISFALVFVKVRKLNSTMENTTNKNLVSTSLKELKATFVMLASLFVGVIVLAATAFEIHAFSMLVQILFAFVSTIYCLLFSALPLWINIYDKKKDNRLKLRQQRALEKEKQKANKSEQDKLLV